MKTLKGIKCSTYMFWLMLMQIFSIVVYAMDLSGEHTFIFVYEDTISVMFLIGFFIIKVIEENKTKIDIYEKNNKE